MIHARAEKPDVIMITESWLNVRNKHFTAEATISGLICSKNTGVLIYVKNGISVNKLNKVDVEEYDSLYVEIKNNNKKYILGVVYPPPKQRKENDMRLFDEIKSIIKDKNTVICGDFNNPTAN